MAIDWIKGFFIPIIEIVFIGGIIIFIVYYCAKAFNNAYKKSFKFVLRYNIGRKPYPEHVVKWCMDCLDKGMGWYDAKKFLLIKMTNEEQVDETMWIYDQIINQLNRAGGLKNNGRQFERSNSKTKSTAGELPTA